MSPDLLYSAVVLRTPQVSRSIGDERDCCACVNYILHSAAPLLQPSILEAHIASLRNMVSKGRDVQAVVAWQQLALLIQSGRVSRSSFDWFVESVFAAAAGPSSPALRMALAMALRACVITHQLPPVPILTRFLSCTLVPEPAVDEVRRCSCTVCASAFPQRVKHVFFVCVFADVFAADHGIFHAACSRRVYHWLARGTWIALVLNFCNTTLRCSCLLSP